MDLRTACQILGINGPCSEADLKKRYRKLMHLAHPDSGVRSSRHYDAREINEAYTFLKQSVSRNTGSSYDHMNPEETAEEVFYAGAGSREEQKTSGRHFRHWNAPVNEKAYAPRPVFHEVEGIDGKVLGRIQVDEGRFYWSEDEAFPLFLLSLYTCAKDLLAQSCSPDGNLFEAFQGELTFLLAKQFIDQRSALDALVKHEQKKGGEIYEIPAMLELNKSGLRNYEKDIPSEKRHFYPASLKKHRLFLKDEKGTEAGYLSFQDDRLYYIVIPLFEYRQVQVRFLSEGQVNHLKNGRAYLELLMEMRFLPESGNMPEGINLEIERLLERAKTSMKD